MDNSEVLGHLFIIESEAALLVNEAQEEADRRIMEAEKSHRAAYEERCRNENEKLEIEFTKLTEQSQRQYLEELESYEEKLSSAGADSGKFSALLSRLIAEET